MRFPLVPTITLAESMESVMTAIELEKRQEHELKLEVLHKLKKMAG